MNSQMAPRTLPKSSPRGSYFSLFMKHRHVTRKSSFLCASWAPRCLHKDRPRIILNSVQTLLKLCSNFARIVFKLCSNSHCCGNHCCGNHYCGKHCCGNHCCGNHCCGNQREPAGTWAGTSGNNREPAVTTEIPQLRDFLEMCVNPC